MLFALALATLAAANAPDDAGRPPEVPPAAVSSQPAAGQGAGRGEVLVSGGFHLSGRPTQILGLHYRHPVSPQLSVRGGLEFGDLTSPPELTGTPITVTINRISGALLTNGALYGGAGLSIVQVTSMTFLPLSATTNVLELIGGIRGELAPLLVGVEARVGLNGPSAVAAMVGWRL